MTTEDTTACSVLLIDDEALAEDLVRHALRHATDITLHFLERAEQAVDRAGAVAASVVLVDLRMPGMDGLAVIKALRAHAATAHLPVILLSSEDDPEAKARAFVHGANDYLVKWPDPRELVARIRYHSGAERARRERDAAFESLRESQRQLAFSQAALHQAQKMEAIGQLTGGVAHDFNNVLQIISGNLQLLKLIGNPDPRAEQRIDLALGGVERGARLAAHLLAFARRQPLRTVVVDPGTVLADMEEMVRRLLGPRIDITFAIADGLWNTAVDPSQLHNVVLNLAINARDAMPDGGTLAIRASNVAAGAAALTARGAEVGGGDHVLIEVADNGEGMAPEVRQRAFEPFFTTKEVGAGSGLGLSMVYGFVKQSGGDVQLHSVPGQGTTVRIFLRQCDETPAAGDEVAAGALQRGVESILVVEDEDDVRETTVLLLSALGYQVLAAADAASAVTLIEAGVEIDLVFTDVIMPGEVSSYDLSQLVKRKLPNTQILFTSGYAEGVIAHEGKIDPSVSLLQKPYSADVLSARIRHLLRRRQPAASA
jgi:signal transduction histidine kinase